MNESLRKILSVLPWVAASTASAAGSTSQIDEDDFWQQVYDSRITYYEKHIGHFPDGILKMGNMTRVWPGGGLFVLQADKIGKGLWAYTTFGMTNPDMPTSTMMADYAIETDDQGQASKYSGTLQSKEQAKSAGGSAGYGYEMLLIAKENAE